MKILYIHQYFCTRAGKSGTRSYEFARHLIKNGHRVTMLTSTSDLSDIRRASGRNVDRFEIEGINVVTVPVCYSQSLGVLGRIRSFLLFMLHSTRVAWHERGHDVVIATSTPLTVGIPGMVASWRWRIPLVFEVRDLWPEVPIRLGLVRNPLVKAALVTLERLIYRRSAHVIALSPGIRDGVLAAGTPAAKVTLIPNCSDLDLFSPGPADPEIRSSLGLDGYFVAVHAGAMGNVNDLGIVVKAAALLEAQGVESVRWLLLGDGSQAAALRDQVRVLGLRSVIFAGSVTRSAVAPILRACDVCLMLVKDNPVLAYASPNKFFDSLAAGRPQVVNTGGWMRELLEEHGAGLASEPGSPEALATHVHWLSEHPYHVQEMGRNARRLAEEKFDRAKLAGAFEQVLLDACGIRSDKHGVRSSDVGRGSSLDSSRAIEAAKRPDESTAEQELVSEA